MVIGDSQQPAVSLCLKPMRLDIYPKRLCYGVHLVIILIYIFVLLKELSLWKFFYEYILPLAFLDVGTWYGEAANIFIALSSTGWTAYSRNTIVWRIQTVYPFMRGVESTPGCKRWGCIGGALFLSVPLLQLKSGTGRRIFVVNTTNLNLCSYSLGRWY
jgi:hypothetical protein